MIEEGKIEKIIKELFDKIEFTSEPAGLYDPLRYMIRIGGKRLRPRLCLTAFSLFSDKVDNSILQPAAGLEVFHTFTLLHDDIMDKSPLRRGQATVWTKWSPDTAILSGDVMSIDSYRRMAMAPSEVLPKVLSIFSQTAAQVCEGQQYDMEFETVPQVSMDEYLKMIGLKTAVLLAASAKIGAVIGGASDEEAEALYRYGYDLGLAFQIADDYLDTYGDEKVFGKPIGGDIVNNKKSWLLTKALESSEDRKKLFELMELPVDTKEQKTAKIVFVKSIYNHNGVADAAKAEIARLTASALTYVKDIDQDGRLKNFADKLVGRAK